MEVQTCKKCSLEIVGGHAYELGDDRWHIQCFQCSKCDRLLGCNSNFLVLGNGLLICLECSYNCKQCGKKIDDLAILTGDQAYCLDCFKCRVCKLKIEDLRYARTSKGLFCMGCHEKLLAKKKRYDLKRRQMAQFELLARPDKQLPPHLLAAALALLLPSDRLLGTPPSPALYYRADQLSLLSHVSVNEATVGRPETAHSVRPDSVRSEAAHSVRSEAAHSVRSEAAHSVRSEAPSEAANTARSAADSSAETFTAFSESSAARNSASIPADTATQTSAGHSPWASSGTTATSKTSTATSSGAGGAAAAATENPASTFAGTPTTETFTPGTFVTNTPLTSNAVTATPTIKSPASDASAAAPAPKSATDLGPEAVEEINDLDDELKLRRMRERLEHRFSRLTKKHDLGAILDLIGSFSGSNTPNLVYEPDLPSPHKNIMLLLPSQYHDNGFHAAEMSAFPETLLRLTASSPMAKANRQARVVEMAGDLDSVSGGDLDGVSADLDGISADFDGVGVGQMNAIALGNTSGPSNAIPEATRDTDSFLGSTPLLPPVHTPRKTGASPGMVSPPPRIALPDVPLQLPFDEPRGLGLDNVEYRRGQAVTNLEATIDDDDDRASSLKETVRRKILLKHKRLVSGGLGGFGRFFKKEEDKGHARHVLEGSVHGLAFNTPPLPFGLPLRHKDTRKDAHSRSTSDTMFGYGLDLRRTDLEMRSVKLEIYQLENYKQNLIAENMKLNSDRNKLLEAIRLLQKRVATESQGHELLLRDVNDLVVEKKRLREQNQALIDDNAALAEENHVLASENKQFVTRAFNARFDHLPPDARRSDALDLDGDEDGELQRAVRLRFWRRAKAEAPLATPALPAQKQAIKPAHKPAPSPSAMSKSRSTTLLDVAAAAPTVPLFSSSLQRRAIYENEPVPLIVTRCIAEVERRGLDVEGIYRLLGGSSAINAIETAFAALPPALDKRLLTRLHDAMAGDINAVTSALKRYLRKLPDPLIPFSLYDAYISVGRSAADVPARCTELASTVVAKLPPANKHALFLVARHLDAVNRCANVNRMNFKNLSVVFAPTLARDVTGEREMVDMGPRNEATELLLSHLSRVFAGYNPETPPS